MAAIEQAEFEAREAEKRRRRETEAWGAVAASADKAQMQAFLEAWPSGQHAEAARARLRELRGGYTRRGALKLFASGAGVTAVAGGGYYSAITPGGYIWRQYNDWPIHTLEGHEDVVNAVAVSSDAKTVVSGSEDKTVKLWEVETGKLIRTFAGSTSVNAVAILPDGKTIVSGSGEYRENDDNVRLWEAGTGKLIRTLGGHGDLVTAVAVTGDGKTIVSGSCDQAIILWDVGTGKSIRVLTNPNDNPQPQEGVENYIFDLTISEDGKIIVSGTRFNEAILWDVGTGNLIHSFKHERHVYTVAILPDGKTIVSGSGDKTVKLWDARTGKLIRTLEGHKSAVRAVAVSPDGKTVVSGSEDATLKLWDAATGSLVHTLEGHMSVVRAAAFAPDGKTVVSGSNDKTLKLWDVSRYLP
ncbi:MAG: WD40 repeat domain-containing protein [Hyphomicrobiales bacterium]|nr:WD40 repeat domain-containing protein [Hyphomicrobiales bacterium]